jgi:hypothetical protein
LRTLATERERSDVLQREALQRIEALTAGMVTDEAQGAQTTPGATEDRAPSAGALPRSAPWWAFWRRRLT